MSTNDLMLLERWAVARDAEAFAEIVSRYSGMVYNTARRVLGNRADAEDVTQECFLELARMSVRIRASLGGWLHAMATSRALDRVRKDARRRNREAQHAACTAGVRAYDWAEAQEILDEAVAALPPEWREPLVEHFFLGRTHDAIAHELGLSRSGVTLRIQRGVEEVRQWLERRGVAIGAGALVAGLTALPSEAVPATLATALGKLALLGAPTAQPGAAAASWWTPLASVKFAAVVLGGLTLAVWSYRALHQPPSPTAAVSVMPLTQPAVAPVPAAATQEVEWAPSAQHVASATANTYPALPQGTDITLMGWVREASGVPIPGARLGMMCLVNWRAYRFDVVADGQGIYRLETPRPDSPRVEMLISATGYATLTTTVTLSRDGETRRDFTLGPEGTARVKVVEGDGTPVPGLRVHWAQQSGSLGPMSDQPTDADGRVRLVGLTPGLPLHVMLDYRSKRRTVDAIPTLPQVVAGREDELLVVLRSMGATAAPGALGVFTGRVTDVSGQPIAGIEVAVVLSNGSEVSAQSDDEGRYRLEIGRANAGERFSLAALHASWGFAYRFDLSPGADEAPTVVDFQLAPGRTFEGRVCDDAGRPLHEALVRLLPAAPWDRVVRWPRVDLVRRSTDADGRFRFDNLPAGGAQITLQKSEYSSLSESIAADGRGEFVLKPRAVLAGRVVDADSGAGVPSFIVRLIANGLDCDLYGRGEAFTSDDGRFFLRDMETDLKYEVTIEAPGYAPCVVPDVATHPPGSTDELVFQVRKARPLLGQVIDAHTGAPIAGADVLAGQLRVEVLYWHVLFGENRTRALTNALLGGQAVVADGRGAFALPSCQPEDTIFVWPRGYAPLMVKPDERAAFWVGERDGCLLPLVRGAGISGVCSLDGVALADTGVSLNLARRAGDADATPIDPQTGREDFGHITTDAAGRYSFADLPAGEFVLHVNGLGERRVVLAAGEQCTVNPGGDWDGPCTFSGRVLDPEGKVLPKLLGFVKPLFEWDYTILWLRFDASGQFALRGLPAGRFELTLFGGGVREPQKIPLDLNGDLHQEIIHPPVAGAEGVAVGAGATK